MKKVIEMDPEIQKEFTESIEKIEGRFRYLVSEEEKNKDVKNPEDIDFLKGNPSLSLAQTHTQIVH